MSSIVTEDISSDENEDYVLAICGNFGFGNMTPCLNQVNDIVVNAGQLIIFPIISENLEPVNYAVTTSALPEGASFANGVFKWIPTEEQLGTFPITFLVSDYNGWKEERTVVIDILGFASDDETYEAKNEEDSSTKSEHEDEEGLYSRKEKEHSNKKKKDNECENKTKIEHQTNKARALESLVTAWHSAASTIKLSTQSATTTTNTTSTNSTNTDSSNSGSSDSGSSDTGSTTETETGTETETETETPAVVTTPPDIPVLTDPGVSSFNGLYTLEWTDTSAFIYELQQARDKDFTDITNTFFPTDTLETVDGPKHPESAYYYYRVRAWSDLPENGGLSSEFSNSIAIGVDFRRDLNVLSFPYVDKFSEIADEPNTTFAWVTDANSLSVPVAKLQYDLTNQFFAGLYFKHPAPITISNMGSLNIRIRGDETAGYPIRMVIELKENNEIQGVILVSNLDSTYQDFSFPFYSESGAIDEVIIFVEDTNDGDGTGTIYIDELFFSEQSFVPDVDPAIAQNAGPALTD